MRHLLLAVSTAALLLSAATAFAADRSAVIRSPAATPAAAENYSGTVIVEKTGQTYRVIWIVGGTRYVGTGIGDKDFLAISYKAGSDTGLALYGSDGGSWAGVWTYAGCRQTGTEVWKCD